MAELEKLARFEVKLNEKMQYRIDDRFRSGCEQFSEVFDIRLPLSR